MNIGNRYGDAMAVFLLCKDGKEWQAAAVCGGGRGCRLDTEGREVAGLNERQRRFCAEYLVDCNARAAAKRAGYSPHSAGDLMRRTDVRAELARGLARLNRRCALRAQQVLAELCHIATARITDYVRIEGGMVALRDTDGMEDAAVAAIAEIKNGARGAEVKLYDRTRALELLGRRLGLFDGRAADEEGVDEVMRNLQSLAALMQHPKRRSGGAPAGGEDAVAEHEPFDDSIAGREDAAGAEEQRDD